MIFNVDCIQHFKSVADNSVDLIVTDPPYGINYKSNLQDCNRRGGKPVKNNSGFYFETIANDDKVFTDWIPECYRILKDNSAIYIFCHWSKWHLFFKDVESCGFQVKNMIILDKSNHGAGDLKGQYAPKHELLMFATKGRHILGFQKRSADIWPVKVKYSGSQRLHPNEKPIEWFENAIINSSKENDLVFDPFMGSGSCLECALRLGRKVLGTEINSEYYKIALNRLKSVIKQDMFSGEINICGHD